MDVQLLKLDGVLAVVVLTSHGNGYVYVCVSIVVSLCVYTCEWLAICMRLILGVRISFVGKISNGV